MMRGRIPVDLMSVIGLFCTILFAIQAGQRNDHVLLVCSIICGLCSAVHFFVDGCSWEIEKIRKMIKETLEAGKHES